MKRIGVIGAGTMGSGIAQVAAMSGCDVILYDAFEASRVKGRDAILASLNKLAEKGKLTDAEAKATFGRVFLAEQLESVAECELIIEAIPEIEQEKERIFDKLSGIASPQTIVATNTSSLSVTKLAGFYNQPDQFIGLHFFNPPVLMPLVEIIPAIQTHPDLPFRMQELMAAWGKSPVVAKDTPGFIVNRIARPYYSEALRMAEEQLAKPEEIDAAMTGLAGFKMGPFELMDFIGHDVNFAVTTSVWTALYYDTRYRPSAWQERLVRAGWLGRKSGRGFYTYAENNTPVKPEAGEHLRFIVERILVMLFNEAADALYYGLAEKEDIDTAMTKGVNYPKGLLRWADEMGIVFCVEEMDALYHRYHEERYRCSPLLRQMAQLGETFYG